MKPYIFTLLLTAIVISMSAQNNDRPFASYENCTAYTYGFINIKDSTQSISPEYCGASAFSEGLAAVKKDGEWGFIDADNKEVIRFQYNYAHSFQHGRTIVQQGDFYGVIDTQGELVIPPRYFDLIPYELAGKRYYISRDSTFFQGIIDTNGNEMIPHRYTYINTLYLYKSNPFYKNIPFYTTYRKIDKTKGSFYDQFKENAYDFLPENGRQSLYDTQFNKLVSRNATSYEDGFNDYELSQIDAYLEDNMETGADQKRKEISRLLDSSKTYEAQPSPVLKKFPASEKPLNKLVAQMGYEKFVGKNGKIGVKKEGKTILPAKFDIVNWWGAVLFSPSEENILYLEEHYAGGFENQEKSNFQFFCIAAGSKEKGALYSMKGKKLYDLKNNKVPDKATSIGFLYRKIVQDTAQRNRVYKFGFVDWKGQDILPPNYTGVKILEKKYILTKREKDTKQGTEEYFGLYDASGEAIIPEGVFLNIEPFENESKLFLAEWYDVYPTVKQQKAKQMENKHIVLLKVEDHTYSVVHHFIASIVHARDLDSETGMLRYRKDIEE